MAKLTKLLLTITFLLAILTQAYVSHETGEPHDHDHDHDHDHNHDHDHEHGHDEEGEIQGNLLDEGGDEIISSLGYDKKENLTVEEIKTLYQKVFFKREIVDEEEKQFYNKIIENAIAGLQDQIPVSDLRNYFDVQYLMRFIEEGTSQEDIGEEQEGSKDSL